MDNLLDTLLEDIIRDSNLSTARLPGHCGLYFQQQTTAEISKALPYLLFW
jgi:hypothetical protein